jgi:glycosyltransferase involved in cell wall biosynthesis
VADVLDAARALGSGFTVHITGNQAKADAGLVDSAPDNVQFTGFLPEEAYQSLLTSCDVVLTLTIIPNIMQCGAYEAVSAGKPLVMGTDKAMSDWFFKGRVTTEISGSAIAEALGLAVRDREKLQNETSALRIERGRDWELLYTELQARPEFSGQRR